jgi:hypothetical protein
MERLPVRGAMVRAACCANLPLARRSPAAPPAAGRPAARLANDCVFCDKGGPSHARRVEERCGNGGNSPPAPGRIAAPGGDDKTERRPP